MLALRDIPDALEEQYQKSKEIAEEIYQALEGSASTQVVPAGSDLYQFPQEDSILYIQEGIFKLYHRDKLIRLFSKSDFVCVHKSNKNPVTLKSEFGSEMAFFSMPSFFAQLRENEKLQHQWNRLRELENQIHLGLCSLNMQVDQSLDFRFDQFKDGDTIVEEGTPSEEIYELVDGEAKVFANNIKVGEIKAGEFFGEISFLTNSTRSATVVSQGKSMVRIIERKDFQHLIRSNPNLIISICQTLAYRILSLNKQISENKPS